MNGKWQVIKQKTKQKQQQRHIFQQRTHCLTRQCTELLVNEPQNSWNSKKKLKQINCPLFCSKMLYCKRPILWTKTQFSFSSLIPNVVDRKEIMCSRKMSPFLNDTNLCIFDSSIVRYYSCEIRITISINSPLHWNSEFIYSLKSYRRFFFSRLHSVHWWTLSLRHFPSY